MPSLLHHDALDRCARMVGPLTDRADSAEQLRRLPDETMSDLLAADLFRMVVPTSLGGHGLGIETLAQCTRILGQGCPASAWTISFLIMHSWLLGKFPAEARAEMFTTSRPWALAPAPLAPTGSAAPVSGGYRVSGRWEWATGIEHADWVMVHAVPTDFTSATGTLFVVVPRADVAVDDVWFTSGMRATGSNTVVLDDVFVPSHRTVPASALMSSLEALPGDGMAGIPVRPVLALVAAAPALGAAEAAVALFRDRIAERVLAFSLGDRQRDQPAAQARLGTVLSELAFARTRWDRALADIAASVGRQLSAEERVGLRLAAAATVRASRGILGTVGEGSGASVYLSSSPLQRLQRDVEVLKGHVIFDWDRITELAGRVALGFELRPTDMA